MASPPSSTRTCSWCGKPDGEVRIVAGPGTNICEACVRLACAVLGIQIATHETKPEAEDTGQRQR